MSNKDNDSLIRKLGSKEIRIRDHEERSIKDEVGADYLIIREDRQSLPTGLPTAFPEDDITSRLPPSGTDEPPEGTGGAA